MTHSRPLNPLLLLLLWCSCGLGALAQDFQLRLQLRDADSKLPLVMASARLNPIGIVQQSNDKGELRFVKIKKGRYQVVLSCVGYQSQTHEVLLNKNMTLNVALREQDLRLAETAVTAQRNAAGNSTSSRISRSAIDHLQASSLADITQLIPGQLMVVPDLTQQQGLQLRNVGNYNSTIALGTSVVIDGVPLSQNGDLQAGGFASTAFAGQDLRQISADDIESVEVVRGVASAEHGDLTSGLVLVNTRIGLTPWQWRSKVSPTVMNHSLSKGFSLRKAGVLNLSLDYAQAWGDPRQKTRAFHRYTLSANWGVDVSRTWHSETKLRLMRATDWNGNDPDAVADGTESRNASHAFSITHNGRLTANRLLARTLNYTLALQMSPSDSYNSTYVAVPSGLLPILTATQTGYYRVPWQTSSYLAAGETQNRAGNFYAKLHDSFYLSAGAMRHSVKVGAEYRVDWNNGRGYFNYNDSLPLRPNSNGRPRPFSDVPTLQQFSAFADDQLTLRLSKQQHLSLHAGLRYDLMQPGKPEQTQALSPRINAALTLAPWIELRGAWGLSSKMPGLNLLYPDKQYTDRVAANYMPQTAGSEVQRILAYHTQVYAATYSPQLRNAAMRKWEAGVEIKLPGKRQLSITAYDERSTSGFGALTDYYTYEANFFDATQGLIISPSAPTVIDFDNPARRDTLFATKGRIGNTSFAANRGVEMEVDLGKIKALSTEVFFSAAYQESVTRSYNPAYSTPSGLPTRYVQQNTTPLKLIYPTGVDHEKYARLLATLRLVTRITALRCIASLSTQVVLHNSSQSYIAPKRPIGYLDLQLQRHELSASQMEGYLGMDGTYYAQKPNAVESISLAQQVVNERDNAPVKTPITWNTALRLTKEFGSYAGVSFYVNNALYYEPYLHSSATTTLSQRNTNSFGFGAELFFKF